MIYIALDKMGIKINILYFSTKRYVVGSYQKQIIDVVLMSNHNIRLVEKWGKKI